MKLVSNNRLLFASLGVNVIFAGWLIFENASLTPSANSNVKHSQEQAHLEPETAKTQTANPQGLAHCSPKKGLEALPEAAVVSESTITPTDPPTSEITEGTAETDWVFKAIKEHPEALQAIQSEQNMRTQIEYNAFLKQHSLSPDLQNALIRALSEREIAPYELDQQDEELIQNEYERRQQQIDSLLGPQLSQELQEYEQIMDSRWTMQDMKQLLDTSNNTFTLSKERQLAKIITNARNNTYEDYKDSGAFDTQGQAELDNSLVLENIHRDILSKARRLLTADELIALDKALQHEVLQSKTSDIISSILLQKGS